MCTQFIVSPTDRFGRKVLQGLPPNHPFRPSWTLTCGWARHRKKLILMDCYRLTGVAGGITAPAHWAIWHATSWHRHLLCLILVILYLPNVASLQNILRTGRGLIFPTAVPLLHISFLHFSAKGNRISSCIGWTEEYSLKGHRNWAPMR